VQPNARSMCSMCQCARCVNVLDVSMCSMYQCARCVNVLDVSMCSMCRTAVRARDEPYARAAALPPHRPAVAVSGVAVTGGPVGVEQVFDGSSAGGPALFPASFDDQHRADDDQPDVNQ
jgi:hypothetical protein